MNSRKLTRQRVCVLMLLSLIATGCQVLPKMPTKSQSILVAEIQQAGGHFDENARARPMEVQTVFLPMNALSRIRPSSLAVFPKLKALMIIETQDNQEHALTGSLVNGADDLLALEYVYRDAGWIK